MVTITRWTGAHARILREVALRMNIYEFAAHTNLSTSTIRDMENKGERTQLRTSTQRILDETLATASENAQQRFTTALTEASDLDPRGVERASRASAFEVPDATLSVSLSEATALSIPALADGTGNSQSPPKLKVASVPGFHRCCGRLVHESRV